MTRIERTFARVLPPRFAWVPAVAALALSYLLCWAVDATIQNWGEHARDPYFFYQFVVVACLGGFGVWRAIFHPAANSGYAAWLATTPWTPDKPLPGGPVLLVWQDVIIVAALSAAFALPGEMRLKGALLWLPLVFVGVYVLVVSTTNLQIGEKRSIVVVAAAVLTLPLAVGRPGSEGSPLAIPAAAAWALAIVAYAATVWGVKRGLRSFPWDDSNRGVVVTMLNIGPAPPFIIPPQINWHAVDRLSPLSWSCVIVIAGLGGWISFAMAECFERLDARPPDAPSASAVAILLGALLAAARVLRYVAGHAPPISLAGRVITGRWLIPQYDKVLFGPLLTLVSAIVLPWVLGRIGAPTPIMAGATAVAMFASAFGVGPSLRDWHLTGQSRLRLSRLSGRRGRMTEEARGALSAGIGRLGEP